MLQSSLIELYRIQTSIGVKLAELERSSSLDGEERLEKKHCASDLNGDFSHKAKFVDGEVKRDFFDQSGDSTNIRSGFNDEPVVEEKEQSKVAWKSDHIDREAAQIWSWTTNWNSRASSSSVNHLVTIPLWSL